MDYGKILGRAWEITWRWKVLWILGFLATLGRGGSGASGNFNYSTGRGDGPLGLDIPPAVVGFLVALVCFAFIIGIILWVVSIIARGGLIAGVQQVEEEGETSFGRAWRAGASRFWSLFGIGALTSIPIVLVVLVGVAAVLIFVVGAGLAAEFTRLSTPAAILGALAPMFICGFPFLCLVVICGTILNQIRVYAERAAVLEGMGWIDAFKRGWQVLKENLGPTVILWLIFMVIGILIGAVVAGGIFAVVVPFIATIGIAASFADPGPWLLLPAGCGGLVAIVLGAAIGSVVETFTSASWTLAYRQLTSIDDAL